MRRVIAFAPGRVNLIGEHTDYNGGLCLPFAIASGLTVEAEPLEEDEIEVHAHDLGERDRFPLAAIEPARGWRAYVRGIASELMSAGLGPRGTRLAVRSELPPGGGLASSAALTIATALALLAAAGLAAPDPLRLARLCARVENRWAGADTGLLDQLAILCARPGHAVRIDARAAAIEPVPLPLDGWTLYLLDSGVRHEHADGGYNERREECARACRLLGIETLREATMGDVARLPAPLDRRARHVLTENERVARTIAALQRSDLPEIARLLDEGHASLRDDFEVSVPEVEATVARLRSAGARGTRMMGGGFGGHVLGLFAPGAGAPEGAVAVQPAGAASVSDLSRSARGT
jgi:galactokinase